MALPGDDCSHGSSMGLSCLIGWFTTVCDGLLYAMRWGVGGLSWWVVQVVVFETDRMQHVWCLQRGGVLGWG